MIAKIVKEISLRVRVVLIGIVIIACGIINPRRTLLSLLDALDEGRVYDFFDLYNNKETK